VIVLNRQHLRTAFRGMRLNRRLSQAQLAQRLHVSTKAISYRESGRHQLDLDVVLETAREFGYDVALLPARSPRRRPTGTGWPA
jgi:transcriptional regulator with XRE-family HTH domain